MEYTYCGGPQIESSTPVTTKTIVQLIDELHQRFGPGYTFEPEAITEGGLKMTTWPNHRPRGYKTVRFNLRRNPGNWPWIEFNTLGKWRQDPEQTIWSLPTNYFTGEPMKITGALFFKAFYGAPCWNPEEVQHLTEALRHVGFTVTSMPVEELDHLREVGRLGFPGF